MAVAPPRHRRPTARHRAASALRAAILEGELRPGQRVNQEDWAARAGVSAIPVREALNALAGEGLVTYRPRRGYVVTELALADLEEVYALRRLLETEALRRGVGRATPDDVSALRALADACRTGDLAARLTANRSFHDRLYALAGSKPLSRLIEGLWDQTEAYRALYYALPGETAEADRSHQAIVAALADGDAAAVVALQDEHRQRTLDRLQAALTTAPPDHSIRRQGFSAPQKTTS
jgi:DNA-binding GntR family transcriptional regulator